MLKYYDLISMEFLPLDDSCQVYCVKDGEGYATYACKKDELLKLDACPYSGSETRIDIPSVVVLKNIEGFAEEEGDHFINGKHLSKELLEKLIPEGIYEKRFGQCSHSSIDSSQRRVFTNIDFSDADHGEAYFLLADLRNTKFVKASCRKTNFKMTLLQGANFDLSVLHEADFQGANLNKANFHNANLWHAKFFGSDLRGANFQGADLIGVNFSGAIIDSSTKFDMNIPPEVRKQIAIVKIRGYLDSLEQRQSVLIHQSPRKHDEVAGFIERTKNCINDFEQGNQLAFDGYSESVKDSIELLKKHRSTLKGIKPVAVVFGPAKSGSLALAIENEVKSLRL